MTYAFFLLVIYYGCSMAIVALGLNQCPILVETFGNELAVIGHTCQCAELVTNRSTTKNTMQSFLALNRSFVRQQRRPKATGTLKQIPDAYQSAKVNT